MGMDGALDVLGARRILHGEYRLADQFARHRPDHVDAENFVVILGGNDFRQTLAPLPSLAPGRWPRTEKFPPCKAGRLP